MRLFSYTVAYDYGSAPNPFWGVCTLTICKPVIRRVAKVEDWIVGLRGTAVVYAMRVTAKMSLADYDIYCRKHLAQKIPDWSSRDYRRKVGDCIYNYSTSPAPTQRPGIHDETASETDLSGVNSLLSGDFYYFGSNAEPLLEKLHGIWHGRGHKSDANGPFIKPFIKWIRTQRHAHNTVVADPALRSELEAPSCRFKCSRTDREEGQAENSKAMKKARCSS